MGRANKVLARKVCSLVICIRGCNFSIFLPPFFFFFSVSLYSLVPYTVFLALLFYPKIYVITICLFYWCLILAKSRVVMSLHLCGQQDRQCYKKSLEQFCKKEIGFLSGIRFTCAVPIPSSCRTSKSTHAFIFFKDAE